MNFNIFKEKYQKVPVKHYPHEVNEKPVVSVCVMTYQHVNYIKDCLDGILMQKTDFPFEILLGEDASKDGSREICIKYAQKYADKIKLFLHHRENNIKINGSFTGRFNFLYNLFSAKGKYIALCEGDDYWTDPLKLQKQVDFLEANSDHSLCFHSVDILKDGILYPEVKADNRVYQIEELLRTKVAHTASFLLRKKFVDSKLLLNKDVFGADLILALTMSQKGKIFGMKSDMAVYRKHLMGITSVHSKTLGIKHYEQFVRQFIFIKKNFKLLPKKAISIKIVDNCMTIFLEYKKRKNIRALKYLFLAVYYRPELLLKAVRKII